MIGYCGQSPFVLLSDLVPEPDACGEAAQLRFFYLSIAFAIITLIEGTTCTADESSRGAALAQLRADRLQVPLVDTAEDEVQICH